MTRYRARVKYFVGSMAAQEHEWSREGTKSSQSAEPISYSTVASLRDGSDDYTR